MTSTYKNNNGTAEQATNQTMEPVRPDLSAPDPANPFYFPDFAIPTGLELNGYQVMKCPVRDDPLTQVQEVQSLTMREDDVIITAYPKCGTHWVAEILYMLTSGQTASYGKTKEYNMLEFCDDLTAVDNLPSPRVLNSHLVMAHLPQDLVDKRVKLVHLIRNSKDTAVSLYHHMKQSATEKFTFDNFLKGYSCNKYNGYHHQFFYLRQMAEFEKSHPGHPIMHIHYEDLKEDPASIIKTLSEFVNHPASDDFCQKVASACSFTNMKKADDTRGLPEKLQEAIKKRLNFYRKGVVGDWKSQFNVAQNEMFDQFLAEQRQKGFGFKPRGEF
ncbi:hypothetical protein RRG08_021402 [Elysia crispata]|uniref:Sulfotransferase domain-containing protein n=1 Tax=Elysia crispata TaxID=231223 RepID=A0AAE0Z6P8_9GAST|nr:hypothetical protein RRG08_021402 [Elysia crispata]